MYLTFREICELKKGDVLYQYGEEYILTQDPTLYTGEGYEQVELSVACWDVDEEELLNTGFFCTKGLEFLGPHLTRR